LIMDLPKPSRPFVSVIIPVLNNAAGLAKCLEALARQEYPSDKYEILVVDNGSSDNVEDVVEAHSRAIMLFEDYPSQAAARNRGILAAKGGILAFTDSDCIPERNWIEKGTEMLIDVPGCEYVGGKISLFFQDPRKPTACELFEFLFAFPQEAYIREKGYSTTANLFACKSLFHAVGLFKRKSCTGSDEEWGKEVHARGYRQLYAEGAVIRHPARRTWKDLSRKQARIRLSRYRKALKESPPVTIRQRLLWGMQSPLLSQFPDQIRTACSDTKLAGIRQRLGVGSILLMRVAFDYYLRFSVISGIHVDDDYGLLRGRGNDDLMHRDSRKKTL